MIDPGLNFFGHSVDADMTMNELRQFLFVVEQFLGSLEATSQVESRAVDHDTNYLCAESFPAILYSSSIISAVIYVERETRFYCDALKKASQAKLGLRDLSGSWLDRFLKFCDKVAELDLGMTREQKEDIRGVLEVRNCLVHAGGYLPDFQRRDVVKAFLKRHMIECSNADFLDASPELAVRVLEIVARFVQQIYEAALTKYPYNSEG